MCSAACASSRFLRSEAYGGSFPTTPIPGCMSYWISWALITGCTHGLQVRASSERLEGRRLKKNQRTPPARGAKWWSKDKRSLKTLEKRIDEERAALEGAVAQLGKERFNCREDAQKAWDQFADERRPRYHRLEGEVVAEEVVKR